MKSYESRSFATSKQSKKATVESKLTSGKFLHSQHRLRQMQQKS